MNTKLVPAPEVCVGVLVHEAGSYILPRFISNLKEIVTDYPSCHLIIATSEPGTAEKAKELLAANNLEADIQIYKVQKPAYATDRIWNITSGRDIIRQRYLGGYNAPFLLLLDSDMLYDNQTISRLIQEAQNSDLVFSGYAMKQYGTGLAGCGCVLIRREILQKIRFRCYEFSNGDVIFEDNCLEMDAFLAGAKIKKGFFLKIEHYFNGTTCASIEPHKVPALRRATNHPAFRSFAIKLAVLLNYNFLWRLKKAWNKGR